MGDQVRCPQCGHVLLEIDHEHVHTFSTLFAQPSGTAPAGRARLVSTSTSTEKDHVQDKTRSAAGQLPLLGGRPIKASPWKRGLAIAHRAIDEYPHDPSEQAEAFKRHCAEQGLDYGERGPSGRPLYARALEYAHGQRRRRG